MLETLTKDLDNDVILELVAIPGKTFQIGSPGGVCSTRT